MPRSSKTGKGGTGPLSRSDGKTYCLDTGNTNAVEINIVAMRGRNPENPKSRKAGLPTEQQLEPRYDGKTNCLTTVAKDNLVQKREVIQLNESKESGNNQPYQPNRVYDINGLSPCLNTDARSPAILLENDFETLNKRQKANYKNENEKANTFLSTSFKGSQANGMTLVSQSDNLEMLNENQRAKFNFNPNIEKSGCLTLAQGRAGSSDEYMDSVSKIAKITGSIRRLTPREAGRLQSVPEDKLDRLIKSGISDTQLYKMFGNGWNIAVVSHIYSFYNK